MLKILTPAPRTAELRTLFSILSGLTTAATPLCPTSAPSYSMYWTLDERTTAVTYATNRWTTPREDKERLQTLLSFMFPYIQKKSDIFGTEKADGKTSSTPATTTFDPWGDSDPGTPAMPELGKLFRMLNVNATERVR